MIGKNGGGEMSFNLQIGMEGYIETVVGEKDTAKSFGSGGVEVYATPMMIGLMENASLKAVDEFLEEGYATVGTHLDVKHLAATPVGMTVKARAKLIAIEGRALTFHVEAIDEVEKIGEGTHKRFIIPLEKFIKKAQEKQDQ